MTTANPERTLLEPSPASGISAEAPWDLAAGLEAHLHLQNPPAPDTAVRLRVGESPTQLGWRAAQISRAA